MSGYKRVFVSVELKDDDLIELTNKIGKIVGADDNGAGVGFGFRDVDFTVKEEQTRGLEERLKSAFPDREVEVYIRDIDGSIYD